MRLRSLEQDRDESGRSFLARLKGLGAVCKLSVKCSCVPSTSVSYADKEILHCFVKSLADEDIRKQVLGMVEEMDLDATVKFVEAKESGKKADVFLDRGAVAVEAVTGYKKSQREQTLASGATPGGSDSEEQKCKFCNRRGHGSSPGYEKKKADCPAFDKTCKVCGGIGHFAKTKACSKKNVKVEKVVLMQHETKVDKKKSVTVEKVVLMQHKKKVENTIEVGQLDSLRDDIGNVVTLSSTKPVPHMVEVKGKWKVQMPKDHPRRPMTSLG